ncbi:hypothetical protein D9757_001178 [Collybiopsis confluens]|uniref:Uncharacterized protein n=1 Tax=Collybiopsis confluens TaxID=2823264 RepID=A0A8H5MGE8_9AGAR|nr:hypothetical protein D9757_001178 [Collybiopsis confluens]
MSDDYSDILGQNSLPIRQKPVVSSTGFYFKAFLSLLLLLVGYIAVARTWESVLKWREKSYRLSLRRRHGIPDNDHRPFNVAYAAVQRAKEEKEKEGARILRADIAAAAAASSSQRQSNTPAEQVRHRPGNQRGVDSSRSGAPVGSILGRYGSASTNSYLSMHSLPQSQSNRVTFADGYNTSASPLDVHAELASGSNSSSSSPARRSGRKNLGILKTHGGDSRKKRERGNEDEDGDFAKKTRVEGDEFIDGDEEAGWQDSNSSILQASSSSNRSSSRGSKRVLGDDEEGSPKKERGKRQRQTSGEKMNQTLDYDDMDLDAEELDQVGDLRSAISRGKKRDRDEAGSSFGGEPEDEVEEDIDIEEEKSRRRKRRNKRRSDANSASRGKKRDRDIEDELGDSDNESGRASRQILRKKRGKKASDELSDVSMEDSVNGSTKGRKIGEEWTSNGVQYKVGPNGQRLRLELVKKARQKFVMPMDSVHPDRKANLEVYVEAWLTEEEYREAKAQRLLSWQQSPNGAEADTPTASTPAISPEPVRSGKHLLWESTTNTPSTRPHDNPFETSKNSTNQLTISANTGVISANKRIASAPRSPGISPSNSIGPSLADSTNTRGQRVYKQFSKWEKQDLEAKAMMRMREANRKKEDEKEEKFVAAPPPALVPKITLTPAAEDTSHSKDAVKPPVSAMFSASPSTASPAAPKLTFNTPATSSPLAADANKAEGSKPPAAAAAVPSFLFAKTSPAPSQASPATPSPQINGTVSSTGTPAAPLTTQPTFSFGPSAGTGNAPTSDNPKSNIGIGLGFPNNSAAPSASNSAQERNFNVPKPVHQNQNGSSTPSSAPPSAPGGGGGGSLFSRGGGTTPTLASTPASAQSAFSFAKPSAAPSSSSPFGGPMSMSGSQPQPQTQTLQFGQPSAPSTPAPSGSTPTPASAAPVKFNFFGGNTGAGTSAGKQASPLGSGNNALPNAPLSSTTSSLSGALGSQPGANPFAPKPSPFGNANPDASKATTMEGRAGSNVPAPAPHKFSFGTPAPVSGPSSESGAVKSAFAGFGSGAPSSSLAPTNTDPPKSAFGFSGGSAVTPASSDAPKSAFSYGGAKPSGDAPTSAFGGFGGPASSTTTTNKDAPKSVFGFGATPSAPAMNGDGPKSAFNFGGNASTVNGNGTVMSAFGGHAFGTAASTTSSSTSPSAFSAPSNSGAFGGSPVFPGFGAKAASASAADNVAKPITTGSAFGQPSNTAGSAPKTAFSFGAPSPAGLSSASGTPAASAPSPFSGFGNSGASAFGAASAAKPAGGETLSKTGYSFGTPANTSTPPSGETPKTAFSFGGTPTTTTPVGTPAKSSPFSFAPPAASAAASNGTTGAGAGAFSFGAPAPSTFGSASSPFAGFGSKPTGTTGTGGSN